MFQFTLKRNELKQFICFLFYLILAVQVQIETFVFMAVDILFKT